MNVSDYSPEALDALWEIVDSYYNNIKSITMLVNLTSQPDVECDKIVIIENSDGNLITQFIKDDEVVDSANLYEVNCIIDKHGNKIWIE